MGCRPGAIDMRRNDKLGGTRSPLPPAPAAPACTKFRRQHPKLEATGRRHRRHAPGWNGFPSDAGALRRMVTASREMIASTTIVAT